MCIEFIVNMINCKGEQCIPRYTVINIAKGKKKHLGLNIPT